MSSYRASFKNEESFLSKIAIGATGTRRVFNHLQQQGYSVVELERGTMSFKIWKEIKTKRLRMPDLLLLETGVRVESRAKTKLEITMSHSLSDHERGWNAGLLESDFIAFVQCSSIGTKATDWQAADHVNYVQVGDMSRAVLENLTVDESPKGVEEGSERRITWPSKSVDHRCLIKGITDTRINFTRENETSGYVTLTGRNKRLVPMVQVGDNVSSHSLIASVVPVHNVVPLTAHIDSAIYNKMLASPSTTEQFTACKALGALKDETAVEQLRHVARDTRRHIYVQIEACATLMRLGDEWAVGQMRSFLASEVLPIQLEAVIVLSEISSEHSIRLLSEVLHDDGRHTEIRAGAAWGLGETKREEALSHLIDCMSSMESGIRVEAARSLLKVGTNFPAQLFDRFPGHDGKTRPGVAWAVARLQNVPLLDLLGRVNGIDERRWIAYVAGLQKYEHYAVQLEELQRTDPEVYFAATVLMQITNSWIHGLEEAPS